MSPRQRHYPRNIVDGESITEEQEKVYRVLKRQQKPTKLAKLAAKAGKTPKATWRILNGYLSKQHMIKKLKGGYYYVRGSRNDPNRWSPDKYWKWRNRR